MLKPPTPSGGRAAAARGFSMIEMLIGVTVGLFLIAGAVRFFTDYLDDHRRLLLEARISQDLRAVADLMVRDLRRAGYWQAPIPGVTSPPADNPYRAVSPSGSASSTAITYSYSRDTTENNAVDTNEVSGFRLNGGTVQVFNSGNWQQLTDPDVMTVTTLDVTPIRLCVSLSNSCRTAGLADACTPAGAAYPKLWVRRFQINLVGRATKDANVVRRIVESVRIRNDEIENPTGCPV